MVSYDGKTVTHDMLGNPLTYDGWSFAWEHGRELASMTKDGTTWTYTYDANGMRKSRTNGTTTYTYVYNGGQLVQMSNGIYTLYFTYNASGHPSTVKVNSTLYYYITNLQGDVTGIWNETEGYICEYAYDAWGNIVDTITHKSRVIINLNPLRYRGYVYDQETSLYYVSSRYYNSAWGRWISADTIDILTATPMGLTDKNLFAYCDNNPIVRADHGGDFWHIVIGAVVSGIISGVVKVVTNVAENKAWNDGLGTAMLAGAASGALAATGAGIPAMIGGNAVISMAENAANQVIQNNGFDNFDVGDMLIDGAIGGVSGAIGGPGDGSKHLTNLGKQTVKRTVNTTTHKGLKAGVKEAGKACAYYVKNTKSYYKEYARGLLRDVLSAAGTAGASSDSMKRQYDRLLGR